LLFPLRALFCRAKRNKKEKKLCHHCIARNKLNVIICLAALSSKTCWFSSTSSSVSSHFTTLCPTNLLDWTILYALQQFHIFAGGDSYKKLLPTQTMRLFVIGVSLHLMVFCLHLIGVCCLHLIVGVCLYFRGVVYICCRH
jgi:hypothetical protein